MAQTSPTFPAAPRVSAAKSKACPPLPLMRLGWRVLVRKALQQWLLVLEPQEREVDMPAASPPITLMKTGKRLQIDDDFEP